MQKELPSLTVTIVSDEVPFSGTRDFIRQVLAQYVYSNSGLTNVERKELEQLRLCLRTITYESVVPSSMPLSLTDQQTIENQLRFFTRECCLREFRMVGLFLEKLYSHIEIILHVKALIPINQADYDFFHRISKNTRAITIKITQEPSSEILERKNKSTVRDSLAQKIVYSNSTTELWDELESKLNDLLNYGDSWTACWYIDLAILSQNEIPNEICNTIGLCYALQGKTEVAEFFWNRFKKHCESEEEKSTAFIIKRARVYYSLAMLYARHHRRALRCNTQAKSYLEEGFDLLTNAKNRQDVSEINKESIEYEKVFNRNGYALILYREGKYSEVIEMLENCIAHLDYSKYSRGIHHTVLLNNLARAYQACGKYEEALEKINLCISIDPYFAEYWSDLASIYCDTGNYEQALESAYRALSISKVISEIPALIGYIYSVRAMQSTEDERKEDLEKSTEFYRKALTIEPKDEYRLLIAHNLAELTEYEKCLKVLLDIDKNHLSQYQKEDFEIISLEASYNLTFPQNTRESLGYLQEKLEELLHIYPYSEEIKNNLTNVKNEQLNFSIPNINRK